MIIAELELIISSNCFIHSACSQCVCIRAVLCRAKSWDLQTPYHEEAEMTKI